MDLKYIKEQKFEKINYTLIPLEKAEYENCIFENCDFSNSNISENQFFECEFINCNLTMCKIYKTNFVNVKFKDCKMLGLLFDGNNKMGYSFIFENCFLNFSSFYQSKAKKTTFINTQLHEVDFTECDLTE